MLGKCIPVVRGKGVFQVNENFARNIKKSHALHRRNLNFTRKLIHVIDEDLYEFLIHLSIFIFIKVEKLLRIF